MEQIIKPVETHLLKAELTKDKLIRKSIRGNNEIYVIDGYSSPALMQEIGRLRELAFRNAGGGTGLSADIEYLDLIPGLYHQLIIWDPVNQSILGGYRYALGRFTPYRTDGQPFWASSEYFKFSEKFIRNIMPYTIELGRSFVSCGYQSSRANAGSIFALDNLWDGLAYIMATKPYLKFFFGKMTMYSQYNKEARDLIHSFLRAFFSGDPSLLKPIFPVEQEVKPIYTTDSFDIAFRLLKRKVQKLGVSIPPLISSYMKLTTQMQSFGTSHNINFGNVEETAILIDIHDIETTIKKHLTSEEFINWENFHSNK